MKNKANCIVQDMLSHDRQGIFKSQRTAQRQGNRAEDISLRHGKEMNFGTFQHPDESWDLILKRRKYQ
jgi:hypothetical protein